MCVVYCFVAPGQHELQHAGQRVTCDGFEQGDRIVIGVVHVVEAHEQLQPTRWKQREQRQHGALETPQRVAAAGFALRRQHDTAQQCCEPRRDAQQQVGIGAERDGHVFWAGVPKPGVSPADAHAWLLDGATQVARRAESLGTTAALEPEPGMLIETVDDWAALAIPGLHLALDTGHCIVTNERDPADAVREFAPHLGTVTIEDMKRGVHVHLPFGEGDMDVPAVLRALSDVGFQKLVCVEMSRESHRADTIIPTSLAYLKAAL